MKLGNLNTFIFLFTLLFANTSPLFAADEIESVPLINLEELSPTFEEDKDILEKIEDQNTNLNSTKNTPEENIAQKMIKFILILQL